MKDTKELYDVIVVGGGPCGIGAVVEARVSNDIKDILLLEKSDNHSQTIRQFYKDNKRVDKNYKGFESDVKGNVKFEVGTKESTLDYFDELLDNDEIHTRFKSEVEKVIKVGDIFEVYTTSGVYKGKNVIICIGKMGKPNKPSYKIPPSITQTVNFNLDKCSQHENILVVGGGNSAIEYAIALSYENLVFLSYRRDKFVRLNEVNEKAIQNEAKYCNVILKMGSDIESIENESGKVLVNFKNDLPMVFDRVIYAIGGSTPVDFLKKCSIKLDENEIPIVDENCETEIPGLYVGGDLITKSGGSIVVALNHAHTIIENIAKRLQN
ncbi:MAG: NAD(P)-binding domain-containing protein [Campylobacter sp.]|nr:NAD(P)-binding domain-containing protein [Campylobacter sp.]